MFNKRGRNPEADFVDMLSNDYDCTWFMWILLCRFDAQ